MFYFRSLIIKNVTWLFLGQAVVKAIAFLYTIFLARVLGVENFGLYVYVVTTFTLVSSLADLGFNRFLVCDLAKDKNLISKYISNVLPLRIILNLCTVIVVSLALLIFDKDSFRASLVSLGLLSIVFNGVALTFDSIFIATEKMSFSALSSIFLNLSISIFGAILILLFKMSTTGAVLAMVLGHFVYLSVGLMLLLKIKNVPRFSFDFEFWKKAVLGSLPYGILAVLGLVYLRIDAVILTFMKGETSTGYYGAAFKFLDGINFIPVVVSTAIFPVMSRLHDESTDKLKTIYFKSISVLFLISIVISLLLFFLAPYLIDVLYLNKYSPSVLALQILAFTSIFSFVQVPTAHLLFATDRFLKQVILLSLVGVTVNILLNFILIPKFDFYGACVATVVSEGISFVIFFSLIWFKVFKVQKVKL